MLNRPLEWSPMRYLGKISYGLYIYHLPIIWFALDIQELGLKESIVKPTATIIAFFGTLLIASITYRFMEKPLLKLKDRFFPLKVDKT
jgi:peptidoglycan/LPS O-acetylase OafA/YrhL